jgi:hypothetical protein
MALLRYLETITGYGKFPLTACCGSPRGADDDDDEPENPNPQKSAALLSAVAE